jgi:hypothetical protein
MKPTNEELQKEISFLNEELAREMEEKALILERNHKLMKQLFDKDEYSIMVVSHDGKDEEKEHMLMMLYESAHGNRLALSDVRLEDGTIKTALCGVIGKVSEMENPEPSLCLFPIFIIDALTNTNTKFDLPGPNGTWIAPGVPEEEEEEEEDDEPE